MFLKKEGTSKVPRFILEKNATNSPGLLSQRLRKQTDVLRKEKRNLLTKRMRTSTEFDNVESLPLGSLEAAVLNIKAAAGTEKSITGLRVLRRLFSRDPPIQQTIDAGLVPYLTSMLRIPNEAVKSDVIFCLANIAAGDHIQSGHVLQAVPDILQILAGNDPGLQELACWLIGNIAADSDEYRAILIANGSLKPALDFLAAAATAAAAAVASSSASSSSSSSSSRDENGEAGAEEGDSSVFSNAQTAAWCLSNLARGSTSAADLVASGATAMFMSLTTSFDRVFVTEVWWLLNYLCMKEESAVEGMFQQGLAAAVTLGAATCDPTDHLSSIPIIRCLGNLTNGGGPEGWLDQLLSQPSLLPSLTRLSDPAVAHRAVLKETTWVIVNLLSGTPAQRGAVLAEGLLDRVVTLLGCDQFDLRREALIGLRCACLEDEVLRRLVGVEVSTAAGGQRSPLCNVVDLLRAPLDAHASVTAIEVGRWVGR